MLRDTGAAVVTLFHVLSGLAIKHVEDVLHAFSILTDYLYVVQIQAEVRRHFANGAAWNQNVL